MLDTATLEQFSEHVLCIQSFGYSFATFIFDLSKIVPCDTQYIYHLLLHNISVAIFLLIYKKSLFPSGKDRNTILKFHLGLLETTKSGHPFPCRSA